jgi:hypothetical protein
VRNLSKGWKTSNIEHRTSNAEAAQQIHSMLDVGRWLFDVLAGMKSAAHFQKLRLTGDLPVFSALTSS